jgi:hypothetical protein
MMRRPSPCQRLCNHVQPCTSMHKPPCERLPIRCLALFMKVHVIMSKHVRVCVGMCMCTHMYEYVCVCGCMCMYACVCVCMCMYMYVYVSVRVCMYVYICRACLCMCMNVYACVCMCMRVTPRYAARGCAWSCQLALELPSPSGSLGHVNARRCTSLHVNEQPSRRMHAHAGACRCRSTAGEGLHINKSGHAWTSECRREKITYHAGQELVAKPWRPCETLHWPRSICANNNTHKCTHAYTYKHIYRDIHT